ncbi:MAG TPA: type I polyketide synthase [Actinocrinis sp.]|nr:type I polyketide synthase [Actinocrinis sp.]
MSTAGLETSVRRLILDRLREWHGIDPEQVGGDRPLAELGATSRDAVALAAELSELTGVTMPATLLWEAGTLDRLARRVGEAAAGPAGPAPAAARTGAAAANASSVQNVQSAMAAAAAAAMASSAAGGSFLRPQPSGPDLPAGPGFPLAGAMAVPAAAGAAALDPRSLDTAVAVVGIGCRLPGEIASPADLWKLLSDGVDAIGTLPEGRWTGFAAQDDPGVDEISRHGGFVGDVAGFDAEFFGIAPTEAVSMDPQQRLLLEVTRESLDHAGIAAAALAGSRTGVFVGISGNEYAHLTTSDLGRVEAWTPPGAALSIAANRLSYVFDLRGPSMALDSACSSSLVAVHHAVRSLAGGECDTALAGGVNVLLSPALTLAFQRAGALAPDGRCKTFDAAADGMVRAEGCGVVVLRRLADAERDGNRVLAVIRASAVNSDGRSNGLLAPNAEAQRALLAEVYAASGVVAPAEVDYVEAHGTGTALGDPVEAGALGAVLGRGRAPDQPLLIGSVKTNLGHLEAAAGITGLIKTVLALHHGELPPHLHYRKPSPHIDFDALALRVVTETEPWPRYSGTATAGVSAFGFGGTNAHVVLQEYRPSGPGRQARWAAGADVSAAVLGQARSRLIRPQTAPAEPLFAPVAHGAGEHAQVVPAPSVLVLDAPTAERLREDAADLAAWLGTPAGGRARLADVSHTLLGRLGRGRHRAAVVTRTGEQAGEALARFAAGQPHPGTAAGQSRTEVAGPVWVFSGYGSQWPGMGRILLDQEPAFAAAIARLEPLIQEHAGVCLRAHLEPDAHLAEAAVVQPVLFALQVALADLWRAHGLRPAAVIGHSMGEVAAAVVAGALTEAAGARVISARSRLLSGLTGGAMAVVDRSAKQVQCLAEELTSLQIAVYSSPGQCVVAGAADEVERLIAIVTGEGGLARPLPVAAAGHTPQVDVLLEPLARALGQIEDRAPDCRFYTTVCEDPRADVALDSAYWVRNLREPVHFQQAVSAAAQDGHRIFVEVSAHPTQLYPITETLRTACVEEALLLPTLRRDTDDAVTFRLSLAALLLRGLVDPAEARGSCHPGAKVVDMPSARWRHQRYWANTPTVNISTARSAAVMEGIEFARAALHAAGSDRRLSTEERLRSCVAQVMGYPPESIGADTALTDLGLDSLQAVRILGVIKHEFGIELTPKVLLRQGTVAQVVKLLEPGGESDPVAAVTEKDDAETVAAAQDPSKAENCECPDNACVTGPDPASTGSQAPQKRGVLPRDATERMVAGVWEAVSGRELFGVEQELVPLARCPQLAASLAHALSEQLGQTLTSADLPADLPTVAAIAARLRPLLETPVQGPVRVLRAEGGQTPLFLIHPAGGSTAVYRALVQRLGPQRPVYGLERPAESSGIVEVADQAAEYVRLIRQLRPQGPWALGGWSYGGMVGHATARLLAEHGTVTALVLIDSVLPLPAPEQTPEQLVRARFEGFADYVREAYDCDLDLPYGELAVLDDAAQVDLVIKALNVHADLPKAVLKHQRDSYLDLRAGERHTPERYSGRTLLYRAAEEAPHTVADPRYQRQDETLGWEEYCSDLDVRPVPGHHLSLLDPPVVDVLGRRLAKDLGLSDLAGPDRARSEAAGSSLIRPGAAKPGALRPVFIRPDLTQYDPNAADRPVTARSEP